MPVPRTSNGVQPPGEEFTQELHPLQQEALLDRVAPPRPTRQRPARVLLDNGHVRITRRAHPAYYLYENLDHHYRWSYDHYQAAYAHYRNYEQMRHYSFYDASSSTGIVIRFGDSAAGTLWCYERPAFDHGNRAEVRSHDGTTRRFRTLQQALRYYQAPQSSGRREKVLRFNRQQEISFTRRETGHDEYPAWERPPRLFDGVFVYRGRVERRKLKASTLPEALSEFNQWLDNNADVLTGVHVCEALPLGGWQRYPLNLIAPATTGEERIEA